MVTRGTVGVQGSRGNVGGAAGVQRTQELRREREVQWNFTHYARENGPTFYLIPH